MGKTNISGEVVSVLFPLNSFPPVNLPAGCGISSQANLFSCRRPSVFTETAVNYTLLLTLRVPRLLARELKPFQPNSPVREQPCEARVGEPGPQNNARSWIEFTALLGLIKWTPPPPQMNMAGLRSTWPSPGSRRTPAFSRYCAARQHLLVRPQAADVPATFRPKKHDYRFGVSYSQNPSCFFFLLASNVLRFVYNKKNEMASVNASPYPTVPSVALINMLLPPPV